MTGGRVGDSGPVPNPDAPRLWTPAALLRHRATVRTVTLPDGRRVKVTVDDSGTVKHIERDDGIDAVVRPRTIRVSRSIQDPLVQRLIATAKKGRP